MGAIACGGRVRVAEGREFAHRTYVYVSIPIPDIDNGKVKDSIACPQIHIHGIGAGGNVSTNMYCAGSMWSVVTISVSLKRKGERRQ